MGAGVFSPEHSPKRLEWAVAAISGSSDLKNNQELIKVQNLSPMFSMTYRARVLI
jgi:hypothetical protein